jgi:predicted Rossmann fold flavoprotein
LVPSLFTFNVEDERLSELAGVAFPAARLKLEVPGHAETLRYDGPLLVTHWGLSGPAVLKLSAFGAVSLHASGYKATLTVGVVPEATLEQALAVLRAHKDAHPKRSVAKDGPFDVPRRFWHRLVTLQGVGEATSWAEIGRAALQGLATEVTQARYAVVGKGVFKEEFVTAGGVRSKEVDFKTMASRLVPGLHFAGELLDVDGITGGFNFQAAWSTAFVAGESMARLLRGDGSG